MHLTKIHFLVSMQKYQISLVSFCYTGETSVYFHTSKLSMNGIEHITEKPISLGTLKIK